MNVLCTFRVEEPFDQDVERIRKLLLVEFNLVSDVNSEDPYIVHFNLPPGWGVDTLRMRLEELINTKVEYADLHRCHQTLQAGNEANMNWFLD